ncbi:MAG TPA: undecaprenyl-phosphate glucose phosphotransferase [Methylophilaceae bacterium]|jgi:putative colanic acid biosynthesis UDP-glucose lipid carrier transferase
MIIDDIPLIATAKRLLDPLVITAMLWLTTILLGGFYDGHYLLLAVLTFFISAHVYDEIELYHSWRQGKPLLHASKILYGWLAVVAILAFLGYATDLYLEYSTKVLLVWILATPCALLLAHFLVHRVATGELKGKQVRSVVIVGANSISAKLLNRIERDPYLFMKIAGYFDDRIPERQTNDLNAPLLGTVSDMPAYVREHHTHIVFICLPMSVQPRIVKLLDEIRDSTASVYFVPDIFVFDLIQSRFDDIHGIPVVSILETPFLGIEIAVKRASDIVFASLILLVLLAPMAIIAAAVKLTSPGPVIFKQRRYGLNGEEIMVYKFRSMTVCEDGSDVQQAQKNDMRVTPLGKILRRTSLDELPQFINVLQGRMSIVGPRPHAVAHNELYRKLIKGYMLRHKVKPGITGWAQVNGSRGETEQIEKMEKRIHLDIEYMRNWSLPLDVWIIFKTVHIVVKGDSAY